MLTVEENPVIYANSSRETEVGPQEVDQKMTLRDASHIKTSSVM